MTTELEIVQVEAVKNGNSHLENISKSSSGFNDKSNQCATDKTPAAAATTGNIITSVTPFSITDILTRMENKEVVNFSMTSEADESEENPNLSDIQTLASLHKRQELSVSLSNVKKVNNVNLPFSHQSPMDLSKESTKINFQCSQRKENQKLIHNNNHIHNNNNLLSNLIKCNGKYGSSNKQSAASTGCLNSGSIGGVNIRDLSSLTQRHHTSLSNTKAQQQQLSASFIEQRLHQARLEAFGMVNHLGLSMQPSRIPSVKLTSTTSSNDRSNSTSPRCSADSSSNSTSASSTVAVQQHSPKCTTTGGNEGSSRRSVSPPSSSASMEEMDASDRDEDEEMEGKITRCEATSLDQRRDSDDRGEIIMLITMTWYYDDHLLPNKDRDNLGFICGIPAKEVAQYQVIALSKPPQYKFIINNTL